MDKQLSALYRLGGLTGILSGFLMLVSSIWFIFGLSSIVSFPSADQFGKIGIFHGIGVVTLILLVPTLLASYGLLSSEAHTRSALGASIAVLWLVMELVAHCSQTAPINELSKLVGEAAPTQIGESFYILWSEWGESLFMTGAFLCALLALFYGSALHAWGNPIAGYLFFISIIAFPIGIFLKYRGYLHYGIELHVLIRGLAFLFLGGVLIQAPHDEDV
ncbi:hypothetical protein C6503_14375 [Candidatus Poribacteria bacterium]|nr:MAG: hypothetical protein C6503_14375 [Candidatus Poribacteria bacterium]